MINDVIQEILEAEKRADEIVAEAKEKAKALLAQNSADIAILFEQAEIKLKNDVENVIFSAEKNAEIAASSALAESKKNTAAVIQKARVRFDTAVKRVQDALIRGI